MLKKGDQIPHFKSINQDGKEIKYTDFKGKKLLIFFYPKASTPGCTLEACNLRDHYKELQEKGYTLLGISADNQEKQKKFHDKYLFPFDLLADESKEICEGFGVWGEKKFLGKTYFGISRVTFIIDEDGIIEEVIEKVKTASHAHQILNLK